MTNTYDAIIVGAGHNGLTAAAYLARAGQKTLVLERRPIVGGTAATETFPEAPGFKFDTGFQGGQPAADVARDLDLRRHGLEMIEAGAGLFAPQPDGGHLHLSPDRFHTTESIGRFSRADADRWAAFTTRLGRIAGLLGDAYRLTMPRLPEVAPSEAAAFAPLALKLRGLGKRDMMEAVRALPMSAVELLDEWFEGEALKGALGTLGIHNLNLGPMAAGTAFNLLHHWALNDGPFKRTARGGLGALALALARAAQASGAEVRTEAEVAQVAVRDGRAVGVVLKNGDELQARRVISALDPRRTFLGLIDVMELEPTFVHAVQSVKLRGAAAKVHLALAGLPQFTGAPAPGALRGSIVISPSLKHLERAHDAAKYGGLSPQPYLEASLPSLTDPTLAPEGRHVMSVHVQFAPYHLKEGAWEAKREELKDVVIRQLSDYAPGLNSLILHAVVHTPADLEARFGLTEGNFNHGEMMLDQILFMRPVPGWAQYRTPIDGLYLCGPGTHPGGGISGLCGRNAAREVLKG